MTIPTQPPIANLEQDRMLRQLIDEASKGLADVAAGNTKDAANVLEAMKRRRASLPAGFKTPNAR